MSSTLPVPSTPRHRASESADDGRRMGAHVRVPEHRLGTLHLVLSSLARPAGELFIRELSPIPRGAFARVSPARERHAQYRALRARRLARALPWEPLALERGRALSDPHHVLFGRNSRAPRARVAQRHRLPTPAPKRMAHADRRRLAPRARASRLKASRQCAIANLRPAPSSSPSRSGILRAAWLSNVTEQPPSMREWSLYEVVDAPSKITSS